RRLVRAWDGRRRLFLVIAPDRWRALRRKLRRPATVLGYERGWALVTNAPLGVRPPARWVSGAAEANHRLREGSRALDPDEVPRVRDHLETGAGDLLREEARVEGPDEPVAGPPHDECRGLDARQALLQPVLGDGEEELRCGAEAAH